MLEEDFTSTSGLGADAIARFEAVYGTVGAKNPRVTKKAEKVRLSVSLAWD